MRINKLTDFCYQKILNLFIEFLMDSIFHFFWRLIWFELLNFGNFLVMKLVTTLSKGHNKRYQKSFLAGRQLKYALFLKMVQRDSISISNSNFYFQTFQKNYSNISICFVLHFLLPKDWFLPRVIIIIFILFHIFYVEKLIFKSCNSIRSEIW
jgi:hypothetical protein